jgi:hypothetical protein
MKKEEQKQHLIDMMRYDENLGLYKETEQMNVGGVSGSLPMYDVDELNEIVTKFNNKEMTLFDFVGRLWNKAYTLGCVDGSKGNDR